MLLVSILMLRNLSYGSRLRACAITTSPPEYRFCYDLVPSMEENVSSLELRRDIASWMALLIPTSLFLIELLTAIYTV